MANDRVDYLQVDIDRIAAGRAGMPIDQLQDAMRAQIEGVRAGVVAEACAGSDRDPRHGRRHRADPAGFRRSDLSLAQRPDRAASDVAKVERIDGPVKLEHENGSRFAMVQAFVSGRDLVGYVDQAKADIRRACEAAAGLSHRLGRPVRKPAACLGPLDDGAAHLAPDDFRGALRDVVERALRCSFWSTFLSPGRGMISLAVSGEYLSVPASVGFIALLGIAVLNGLVMVSYFRQLRERDATGRSGGTARSGACARC
jgi:cobalt-zinc-cadmium resistance protein CzcA